MVARWNGQSVAYHYYDTITTLGIRPSYRQQKMACICLLPRLWDKQSGAGTSTRRSLRPHV
jgi:hypothetical protein